MRSSPLFYPVAIETVQLQQYARGLFEPPSIDIIEFPAEEGGVVSRELAVPFLPGMDSVHVTHAALQIRSRGREIDADFSVQQIGTPGVVIVLPRVARLSKVSISYSVPAGAVAPGQVERIVVRSAVKEGSTFAAGPPLFADPGFGAPGPMFPAPLAGMSVTRSPTGAVLTLPRPLGDAWLVQLATGDEAVKLSPLSITPTVRYVRIDAVPRDLVVTLKRTDESPQIWGHPDLFLPEIGVQDLDFSPLAQKQLSDALAAAEPGHTVTLPLALEFHSTSGGDLAVASRTLDARYTVDAAGTAGQALQLGGTFTPLVLSAPAALRPVAAEIDLTLTALGRELNAGSGEPSPSVASRGVSLRQDLIAAAACSFVARDPVNLGASPLVAVRVFLSSLTAAEVVLEVRTDAAGAPGPPAVPPAVRQIDAGFHDWLEFELTPQWTPSAEETMLWVSLRTNSGDVFWFSEPEAAPAERGVLVSLDRGGSWGSPAGPLEPVRPLLVQLFNAVPDPQPEPIVRLHLSGLVLSENLLRTAGIAPQRQGPREFTLTRGALPPPLATALQQQPGNGKVDTRLLLFSRAVVQLQITRFVLEYDPFQASAAQ